MLQFKFSALSIRYKLPLLICLLLSVMIVIFGWISYYGVRNASIKVAQERLQVITDDLKAIFSGSTHGFMVTTFTESRKPAVKEFLLSHAKDSFEQTRRILESLGKDSLYLNVSLLDANGKPVLSYARNGITISIHLDSTLKLFGKSTLDSGLVGKLYQIDNRVYYPIVAPVKNNGEILGFIVRWRALRMSSRSLQQLTRLMGSNVHLYLGNDDGSLWTDLQKPVPAIRTARETPNTVIEYKNHEHIAVLSSSRPIENSHWLVVVELSKNHALQASRLFLYWLIIGGTILLLLGVFLTWVMSRKITQPLRQLILVSSAMAEGNYCGHMPITRNDEFGKLARSFNAMTAQVRKSQDELQRTADSYKLLFEKNPMPMWITSNGSSKVLNVNEAAIKHYGYPREEFLNLASADLLPGQDVNEGQVKAKLSLAGGKEDLRLHRRKNGSIITVEIMQDDIFYNGEHASLILAHDVTEKLRVEAELIHQRITQQEIITETTMLAQEKEREQLGKELHDNINQILASSKIYLELARNGQKQLQKEALSKSYSSINLAIEEIRNLSRQLVPPALDDMLINVLREMLEEVAYAKKLNCHLEADNFNENRLCDNIKLMLYRIVQEQVNNIIKHAEASKIVVRIEICENNLFLIIEDDGKGFNTAQKPKGIGLRNIESRVEFYKGKLAVFSQKGQGCRLAVSIPSINKLEQSDLSEIGS
jgi:PAS domain S-box-containing protein